MGYPIVIGRFRGEVLLDLEGLFLLVSLNSSCSEEEILSDLNGLHLVGVLLLQQKALFVGSSRVLSTDWNQPWLEGLLRMVEGADPLQAERIAERVFLRRIFAKGLQGLLELERHMQRLKKHAKQAEEDCLHAGAYAEGNEWKAWLQEIEDIEPRLRNLELTLGRFAVRLGNRWLWGSEDDQST